MSRYAVITDLNRCVSCLNCIVACKEANEVPIGNYWIKVLRVGPNPKTPDSVYPDVEMYYLPVNCQHCENPTCAEVCPTGATFKTENGSVQVDHDKCIGCQACVMACPYGVRYLNEDEGVVEKCTRCYQKTNEGEMPACVTACGGSARFFGDLDAGYEDFHGRLDANGNNISLLDESYVKPFTEDDVHTLPDAGNGPSDRFILRNRVWR